MAADIVLDANAVGDVVTYVAPGFLAYTGYRLRYPGESRPPGEVLIISVVTSLPLVALVTAALPGAQKPSQLGYLAILLVLALAIGYVAALIRGTDRAKGVLGWLGYRMEPDGSIYSQTLRHLSPDATVVVEFKNGLRISGCPRNGPQHKEDGVNELYLVYPMKVDDAGSFEDVDGAGIIIPLSEVTHIVLSEDPTRAPTAEARDDADAGQRVLQPGGEKGPGSVQPQDGSTAVTGSESLEN